MRILFAAAIVLAGSRLAFAAGVPTNVTNLSYDSGHGTQVEYVAPGGSNFLWYPGNAVVLPGHWKTIGGSRKHPSEICFVYGPNTYNPVTGVVGAKWECEPINLYLSLQTERAKGDVFGLAHRRAVPFVLRRAQTTLRQLAAEAGHR
jgi:hypothetical protein